MAVKQFKEPDINLFFDDLDQVKVLNNKATFIGKGCINVTFTQINSYLAPVMSTGSAWEANGVLFYADSDTEITGTPADNARNYVYALPSGVLQYGSAAPIWNSVKGGWYNGNNRALMKFYYASGGTVCGNKIILDSYNAQNILINKNYAVPASGGYQAATGVVNEVKSVTLEPGWYRYEMKAGRGGNGGGAGGGGGGIGAEGESKAGNFILEKPRKIRLALGGDGNDGGIGGNGGGGGGCSGGSAFLDLIIDFILCMGGSGGGGGGGGENAQGAGAGGGGGGYGNGTDGNGTNGGQGGKDGGIGGNGGTGTGAGSGNGGGAGGSGYIAGGIGGGGRGNAQNGATGGGYGGNGGNGGNANGIGKGGDGGNSETGETTDPTEKQNTHGIQYQGGGGGGGGNTANSGLNGGAGGGDLKDASSGYLRIYRVG